MLGDPGGGGVAREREGGLRAAANSRPTPPRGLALDLVLFAGLAGLAVVAWARLVADPPVGRAAAMIAIACAAAAALAGLSRTSLRRPARTAALVLTAVAATGAGLLAAGLEARLLAPANWDELGEGIGEGARGIEEAALPYDGNEEWIRLTLLLAAPPLLAIAALVAFTGPGARRRLGSLLVLVSTLGLALTLDSHAGELWLGAALFPLAAAWLWLPAIGPGQVALAAVCAVAAGGAAVPIAGALEPQRAWLSYERWNVFTGGQEITFDWNHSYGPLDWPQRGTTLLEARSDAPVYWKASVLDRFDGFSWLRADSEDALATPEIIARTGAVGAGDLADRHPRWRAAAEVEVRRLESDVALGPGTTFDVDGIGAVLAAGDGTLTLPAGEIGPGAAYTVEAYVPDPSPAQMRRASRHYSDAPSGGSTLVGLPASVARDAGFGPGPPTEVPLWGDSRGDVEERFERSPYAGVHALAERLTAGAPSGYDAARAIEEYLDDGFDYSEQVDQHTYPLAAFLLEDRAGYCQQFAGAMALMLRMVGVPARVVSGFAPGSYDRESRVYRIADTDAHSWVEVYFEGLGWVTFDPTPAAAPARARTIESALPVGSAGTTGLDRAPSERSREPRAQGGDPAGSATEGGIGWPAFVLAIVASAALLAFSVSFWVRRRRLRSGAGPELQGTELVRALERLGWSLASPPTLFAIERRFEVVGRAGVSRYARALRRHRYAREASPPGPRERRALRRALGHGGFARRLRALALIPPGGPAG